MYSRVVGVSLSESHADKMYMCTYECTYVYCMLVSNGVTHNSFVNNGVSHVMSEFKNADQTDVMKALPLSRMHAVAPIPLAT